MGGNCILKVTLFFLFWPPAWGTCLFSNRYAKMAVNGAQMNLGRVKLATDGYLAILVTPSWWVAKFNHQGDIFI